MLAARLGKDDRLPLLIAKGADVNARDNTGATALMVAAAVQWDEQAIIMLKRPNSGAALASKTSARTATG